MRSMTGFGCGSYSDGNVSVTIEMRAVNQRYLELNIRMPHSYLALEDNIRTGCKNVLHRGKVDVFISVSELRPQAPTIRVDQAALQAVKEAADTVKRDLFDGAPATLDEVMNLSTDWFVQEPPVIDAEAIWPVFEQALRTALDGMVAMREKEGANLARDLQARADVMLTVNDAIASRREEILLNYQAGLEKKILNLFDMAQSVPDQERLLQEVAIYADKVDFTEEVVRFRSHVLQLKEFLNSTGAVGRKLDFLIQEMNREVNTIGSKAANLDVTEHVLQLKNEIEKIREQVQNIE